MVSPLTRSPLIDSSFKLSLSLTYPGGEVELQSLPRCFSSRSLTHSEPVSAFLLSIRTLGGAGHQGVQVHPYLLYILGKRWDSEVSAARCRDRSLMC